MDFGLLGTVAVRHEGQDIPVRSAQQRCVLALLLLEAGRVVPADRLVDALWDDDEIPKTARNILQGCVSSLRRLLADDPDVRLVHKAPGYVIEVPPDRIDLVRFRDLVARARGSKDEAALLREALGLWRSEPLADVDQLAAAKRALTEERLSVLEDCVDAELRLGRHGDLVPELTALTAEHPLRERLRDHLMLALYRAGRASEALNVYHDTLTTLREEIGTDPGPALQRRYEQILRADVPEHVKAAPAPELEPPKRFRRSRVPVVSALVLIIILVVTFLVVDRKDPNATTAAERYGWGTPVHSAEFADGIDGGWVARGPKAGREGKGRQVPDQVSVRDDVLTITGLPNGDTGYLSRTPGSFHGRWEARIRVPSGCACYRPLLTLWPDANDFPAGGEIVYLEAFDADREAAAFFVYSDKVDRLEARRRIDLTAWNTFAVEWAGDHVTGYVNGEQWFHTVEVAKIPPRSMYPTIKLDLVPSSAAITQSTMEVDWIREYGL